MELNILHSLWLRFGWRTNIDVRCKIKKEASMDLTRRDTDHNIPSAAAIPSVALDQPSSIDVSDDCCQHGH